GVLKKPIFVQLSRAYLHSWRALIRKNPFATVKIGNVTVYCVNERFLTVFLFRTLILSFLFRVELSA
ncbi:hypothetical protein BER12_18900, partial [Escherichia coli]